MRKRPWQPLALAMLISASGCSLVLDFSDESPGGDGGTVDAFDFGDGGAVCSAFEPNNDLSTAMPVPTNMTHMVAICPAGDFDFYSFDVVAGQDVVMEITFDNMGGAGDLEMRLYDGAGQNIDGSMSFSNMERIERTAALFNQLPQDTYRLEVYGFQASVQNTYMLTITVN